MKDGGPAFPQLVRREEKYMDEGGSGRTRIVTLSDGGMTLRDYFAAKAVVGIMSTKDSFAAACKGADENGMKWERAVALLAYSIADSMISVREMQP